MQPNKKGSVSDATPASGEVQTHGLIQQRISSLERYSLEATVTSNTHDSRIEMLESTVRTLANEVQVASAAIMTLSENVPGGAQPLRPPLSTGVDAEDIKIQVTHDLTRARAARAHTFSLTYDCSNTAQCDAGTNCGAAADDAATRRAN